MNGSDFTLTRNIVIASVIGAIAAGACIYVNTPIYTAVGALALLAAGLMICTITNMCSTSKASRPAKSNDLVSIQPYCPDTKSEKEQSKQDFGKLCAISHIMCDIGPQVVTSEVREVIVEAGTKALSTPYIALLTIDPYTGDIISTQTKSVTFEMKNAYLDLNERILTEYDIEEAYVLDLPQTEDYALMSHSILVESGMRSVLSAPIRSNAGATGAIVAFYNNLEGARDNEEIIKIIATEASAVLSYSMAMEQSRCLLDDIAGQNQELSEQATVDGLTGLLNHRTLQQNLSDLCKPRTRGKLPVFSIMMVDVDHFKLFNDTHGHQEGDVVLKKVARALSSRLRQSDFAARYGGEEFALVIRGVGKEEAANIADRIRAAISRECYAHGTITVSIGISEYPFDASTPSELIEKADKALYKAKTNGRNRVVVWGGAGYDAEEIQEQEPGNIVEGSVLLVQRPNQDFLQEITMPTSDGPYRIKTASNQTEAIEMLRKNSFEAIVVTMESLDHDLKYLNAISAVHPNVPTLLISGVITPELLLDALHSGASDVISRPSSASELNRAIEINIARHRLERSKLNQSSNDHVQQSADALFAALSERSPQTARHSARVASISVSVAEFLAIPNIEKASLEMAAKLHDVGVLPLSDSAINGKSDEVHEHVLHGSKILGIIDQFAQISVIVRHHHERMNGAGYPDGLRGGNIPQLSRIIAVVDQYDRLTQDADMSPVAAYEEISRRAGQHFDSDIVKALRSHLVNIGEIQETQKKAA